MLVEPPTPSEICSLLLSRPVRRVMVRTLSWPWIFALRSNSANAALKRRCRSARRGHRVTARREPCRRGDRKADTSCEKSNQNPTEHRPLLGCVCRQCRSIFALLCASHYPGVACQATESAVLQRPRSWKPVCPRVHRHCTEVTSAVGERSAQHPPKAEPRKAIPPTSVIIGKVPPEPRPGVRSDG